MIKFVIVGFLAFVALAAYACVAVSSYSDPYLWEGE